MIARVESFVLQGIEAHPCEIEADLQGARTPGTTIVGLPDAAVRESIKRVHSAIANAGFEYPRSRTTINLAPAHLKTEGPVYDLPIAIAILSAAGVIRGAAGATGATGKALAAGGFVFAGELALDGRLRPVCGVVSMAHLARARGRGVVVPVSNAAEAAVVSGVDVRGVRTLTEVVAMLNGTAEVASHPPFDVAALAAEGAPAVDFAEVRGQEATKRALTIAAAGGHNVLMLGPAGTGKTMMARALVGVLPPMSAEEALEVTRIYSCVGRLDSQCPLVALRPVRSPHHTASSAAIVGGGTIPKPGDVSLAHRGVLFLDEMPEFSRDVLETLRQPLEEGRVTIARRHGSVRFPARFMLVAALNPTRRGDMTGDEAGLREMRRYLARLSRPLVDRIDLHVEVPALPWRHLCGSHRGTDSATIRARVLVARRRQSERQGALANAELPGKLLDEVARLGDAASLVLEQAMAEMGLSARAYDKVRRVARTIADLEGDEAITETHVAEAVGYRLLDRLL